MSRAGIVTVPSTSLPTMPKWEVGGKKPSAQSLKFPNLIERMRLEGVV